MSRWSGYGWRPYVPVAKRKADATKQMEKMRKKGMDVQPVVIEGRKIAGTFWGEAWCDHLEKFSDYANRLPRGRTYVRNGLVCHLEVKEGEVFAHVSGSSLYKVKVTIQHLSKDKWKRIKDACAGKVGSLIELLQGKLSNSVMSVVTDRTNGLFPLPGEIKLSCSCPDWADMCKHVAAVLYGVGARLDVQPELLFALRGVDHAELVGEGAAASIVSKGRGKTGRALDEASLADVFGIDVAEDAPSTPAPGRKTGKTPKAKAAKAGKRKSADAVKPSKAKAKKAKPATRKASAKKTTKK